MPPLPEELPLPIPVAEEAFAEAFLVADGGRPRPVRDAPADDPGEVDACCCCCGGGGGGGGSLLVDISWIRTPGPAGESSSTIPGIVCIFRVMKKRKATRNVGKKSEQRILGK